MDKLVMLHLLRLAVRTVPDVLPHLSPATRYQLSVPTPYKTFDFFRSAIIGLVEGVYQGFIAGFFIDTMANLISGQLRDAFMRAWADEGFFREMPPYLEQGLEAMILQQYQFVDRFYRDIVDARIDGTPIGPLLARAEMWANQWNAAYNEAIRLIALNNGGKLMWVYGDTDHCDVCYKLNGIVAFAREWDELDVQPQNPPNWALRKDLGGCGGWRCKCRLEPTDKRRSPKAFNTIMNIVGKM